MDDANEILDLVRHLDFKHHSTLRGCGEITFRTKRQEEFLLEVNPRLSQISQMLELERNDVLGREIEAVAFVVQGPDFCRRTFEAIAELKELSFGIG